MKTTTQPALVNGIDTDGVKGTIAAITANPALGAATFRVRTAWKGGTRNETTSESMTLGGKALSRKFRFVADEPPELFGNDGGPNPQEYLLGALGACMTTGFVAIASLRGIRLDSLEIEIDGRLDLRGFLSIDPAVAPGYETLRYRIRVRGDATREQFAEIHEAVRATSPNYFNLSRPIVLEGDVVVA
jgi:uncharacterized OsmC-like protein